MLSIAPGSRTIMVELVGGLGGNELATVFFIPGFGCHGTEDSASSTKRLISGVEVLPTSNSGTSRIDLELKTAKEGALDFIRVKKTSGHLAHSDATETHFGEIKTEGRLN